ncbi:glycosyl hydrolase 115 family protein [Gilvimarinus sp. SDUM040013]|uniref:Glycosyl hydrolase 115 family protein n=1 Tax=Gilvimarinus gilvus TaxID=3058038 RepID=A0ABU4RWX7_9GAMM|nr:glycosyl hydrolase 115 family protein [Gilvimarinus sp. SDUM040013]MDO3387893.1 glycosyl hydrolase 115 family protein [Gilvimarinus sp. SDUM040013]MDX6848736.1 glycosyl hydrolase 115 family protein [Gilvimarinus sp. SDUM040013]
MISLNRFSRAMAVLLAVAIVGCSKVADTDSSSEGWVPYDGMMPVATEAHHYFAVPFMEVLESPASGALEIAANGAVTSIYHSAEDAKVVEIASAALRDDIERVTGLRASVSTDTPQSASAILVGTVGQSPLIDGLVDAGKIDVAAIKGKWEAYTAAVVDNPLPGVERGLVIAGSDRRGTAFGVFGLSESIGVSPWHFWGDVPAPQKPSLYIAGSHTQHSPGVKYRGIFINDEDWGFQPWAANTFEPEVGNIGPRTYATVFELVLRLYGNVIWPAMHEFPVKSTPFYEIPENKVVADNYAIVISTSHHEPMLTNSHEYDEDIHGPYDYWSNRDRIFDFWQDRVKETADYENIYTIGMRGRRDEGMMAPEGTTNEEKAAKIQNTIIPDQRSMIANFVHPTPSDVPQIFIPYKETLVQYQSGLKLPEDVIILWPDDNHGYIRQLSTPEESARSGGSGVYYHMQYWGVPRSYLWFHSTPLGMTHSEMLKAWDFNAHNIWINNVGDIKPYEIGTEFFMRLARNPEAFRNFDQHEYLTQWAARTFGNEYADAIAAILGDYYRLNIVKRPEQLDLNNSGFSHVENGDEAQQRLDAFADLTARANGVYEQLPASHKPAFYEMVLYSVRASDLINQKVLLAERSRLWEIQGRAATVSSAAKAQAAQKALLEEVRFYNKENANGKWDGMVSPMPLSELPNWAHDTQRAWTMPEVGDYNPGSEAGLGVMVEGSSEPLNDNPAELPTFSRPADASHFIDIFNRGDEALSWTAEPSEPWINLSQTRGVYDVRIWVSIDWAKAPYDNAVSGAITVTGAGSTRTINLNAYNPEGLELAALPDAVEHNGVTGLLAVDFKARKDLDNGTGWRRVSQATASGDGMTIQPVTAPTIDLDNLAQSSPSLSYDFYAYNTGAATIYTQTLPTHKLTSGHKGLRYAISLNGDKPRIVDIHADEYTEAWNANTLRAAAIGVTKHQIAAPGLQTIQVWMVDAGVMLEKFTVKVE